MYFITGGIHAGKTAYVTKHFGIHPADMTNGADCAFETALTAVCIQNYQQLVRRLLADGREPLDFTKALLNKNPDVLVLIDEIGCGIVPLEQEERRWREYTGWCGCLLAEQAKAVVRLCCGCPAVIKGELP